MSLQIREILGVHEKINLHFVHLCDEELETIQYSPYFKSIDDFQSLVKLPPNNTKVNSTFRTFDVNDTNIGTEITNFMNENKINFLFCCFLRH
jgi:hypothetical protein